MMKKYTQFSLIAGLFLLVGCEGFFGKKTSIDFIEIPEYLAREVAYVPVEPALNRFQSPVDIIAGYDELIYVVDDATEEIISLDESGRELGRFGLRGVKSVAQNRSLDLLAIGTTDRLVGGSVKVVTCIYKVDLHGPGASYGIQYARVVDTIAHPQYFKSTFSGTDTAVVFNKDGTYQTPVAVNTPSGFFRDYFKKPTGISSFVQPPQISAGGPDHFVYTSVSENTSIKVQVIDYIESDFGASYEPRLLFENDKTVSDGNLGTPDKFERPVSTLVTGDGTNFIFVVDEAKDSLYQFTVTGLEGVKPPPGAASTKYQMASFGGRGDALTQFNKPTAVAYKNRILWVCDNGNGRVLRFKLTTDFQ